MAGVRTADDLTDSMKMDLQQLHQIEPQLVHDFLLDMIHEYTPPKRDRSLDFPSIEEIEGA